MLRFSRRLLPLRLLLALAAFVVLWAAAPVDPPGVLAFRSYDTAQGLTNLSITALAQDSEGFLWIGTEDGLFRLEGNRMHRYGLEDGLPDESIGYNGLGAGEAGALWVSTRLGIACWNGSRFQSLEELGIHGLEGDAGLAIQGGMILRDAQFHRYLYTGRQTFRDLKGLPETQGLGVGWLSGDGQELLVTHGSTLWSQRNGQWRARDLGRAITSPPIALLRDHKGSYWIRTDRSLIYLETFDAPLVDLGKQLPLSVVNGGSLVEDPLGRVWTPTPSCLAWFEGRQAHLFNEEQGLPKGGANVLLVDAEGDLLLGGSGVHQLLGGFAWSGYTRQQGLPAHTVWSLLRTRDGLLWAGTSAGMAVAGPTRFEPIQGTLRRQIMAMAEDADGNLWAAPIMDPQEHPALFLRRPGSRSVEMFPLPGAKPGESAIALTWNPEGYLWVSLAGAGLFRLQRVGGQWRLDREVIAGWPVDGQLVLRVLRGPDGIWWAVGNSGVACRIGTQWVTLAKAGGLEADSLLCLAPLDGAQAWVSYADVKGLSRIGFVGGQLQVLETLRPPHHLAEQPILSLGADRSGALWAGTSIGVKRWQGSALDRFDHSQGLPGEDCSQNSLLIEPSGDIWVGLSVGIAHLQAALWKGREPTQRVRLMAAVDARGRSLLNAATGTLVPYPRRTVTFNYLPIGYGRVLEVTYQVRLVGLEDAWRDTSQSEARYPNLPPGSYRFEVRTKDWSGRPTIKAGLSFQVLQPWWQTWWFLGTAFGLAALAIYGGIRWRTRLILKRMVRLEALVHERTWDLEEANEALAQASMVDPLTGLKNRRFLRLAMPELEARSIRAYHGAQAALPKAEDLIFLMVDLDHFKQVNDTHGHAAGDAVLIQVANLLRAVCREGDSVVRWGGEEFLVVGTGGDRFAAEVIAENIVHRIRAHTFELGEGRTLQATCSVGYSAFPLIPGEPGLIPWEGAVEVADQCLYAVKKSGRNGWMGVFRGNAEVPESLREGFPRRLPHLVAQGQVELRTSLPADQTIRWKD